ncbi:MAG: right-handed parallel beta-helix repeat-containing protein [Candidatus Helarchaeota archaeon]|nr:right-handed parallel beta-helix repeat-containing protein [Candidatus Helarchaeota archaeon]
MYILGNSGLAAAASSGNGTAEYPYIIENETIDFFEMVCLLVILNGPRIGILVRNTTKHFIIRNCDIDTTIYCRNSHYAFYGVWLDNVTNASLINNSIQNSDSYISEYTGVLLSNCSNVNLSDNVISNHMIGIYSYYSNFNLLTENTVNTNFNGFYFETSSNNTISNNTVNNNFIGIWLDYSNYNLITGNTFFNNYEGIIEDSSCVGNSFKNNIIVNRVAIPPYGWLLPTLIGLGLITTIFYLRKKSKRRK